MPEPRKLGGPKSAADRVAAAATVLVGDTSRRLGLGDGSVIGGRVGIGIDRSLVAGLATGMRVALVSGTNGKTTTTRLLAAALGGPARVATSGAGANLPAGIASALAKSPGRDLAVLEVDEGFLGSVADAVRPEVILLLNLSRDQLDRVNEVRMVARKWRDAVSRTQGATIVANADDPLVVWAAMGAASAPNSASGKANNERIRFVAAGQLWHEDATGCPECDGRISFGDSTGASGWACSCGFRRPDPYAVLTEQGLEVSGGRTLRIDLSLPARCNRANAAMAAVAAGVLGTDEALALAAMSGVSEVEGRFATADFGGVKARMLLAKNPAGWAELLDLLDGSDLPVVIGINARTADGYDPSWLWDVPFERLAGRKVIATGERAYDLAVRLGYADVEHEVFADQSGALAACAVAGMSMVEYVGNYTAFQQLRRAHRRPSHGTNRTRPSDVAARNERAHRPLGTRESAIRIAVVFPDLLGTYGDGGNGVVLAKRAAWRGLPAELVLATSDRPLPTADLYCIGGGEDGPQVEAAELLSKSVILRAVEDGSAVLAVCAGFQIVGREFPDAGGTARDGLGLLDVVTQKGTGPRAVGEVVAEPVDPRLGRERLTGFENHSGDTILGREKPLGRVTVGVGNSRSERHEGAVSGRVIGTYLHGPVLGRNPHLADLLLEMATGLRLESVPIPYDEVTELRAERFAEALGGKSLARRRRIRLHR